MLQIENLTFSYRRRAPKVLDDFSLTIESGKICGLLGRNGAGKSTLLHLIAGLLTPKSGRVLFDGVNTRLRRPSTLCDMFIVPEEFSLPSVPFMTYIKNNAPFYPNFSMEDVRTHLSTFELVEDMNLSELSMGQKKKAFMCFALACNTSLLLMDEPTNGLDIPGKSRFRKFIVSNMADDRTIIISTHQVRDIDRILDHVIITDSNKVLLHASVAEITSRLKFVESDDRGLIEKAIYAQPSLGGASLIFPNTTGEDTEMNLESLFELSLRKPEIINEMFNKNTEQI